MVEGVTEQIMEVDPNVQPSLTTRTTINNAVHCYKDLYEEKNAKKKFVQISILNFLVNKI